jgi:hypothetical protein
MRLRRKDEVVIFIGKTASRCILGGAIEGQVSHSHSKRTHDTPSKVKYDYFSNLNK